MQRSVLDEYVLVRNGSLFELTITEGSISYGVIGVHRAN